MRHAARKEIHALARISPDIRDIALADLEMLVIHGEARTRALASSIAGDIIGHGMDKALPRFMRSPHVAVRIAAWDAARASVTDKPCPPASNESLKLKPIEYVLGPPLFWIATAHEMTASSNPTTQADWPDEPKRPGVKSRIAKALRPFRFGR